MASKPEPMPAPPRIQRISAVLWPAFLCAGVATTVFFTFFDPVSVLHCEGKPPLGRTAAYSLGFFGFWLLTAASSTATLYFSRHPAPREGAGDRP